MIDQEEKRYLGISQIETTIIAMDEVKHKQSVFFQKSEEEIALTLTNAFHEVGKDEIITATLAELYFSQGFLEKSIEIYKKLLRQQPDKAEWAKRLVEIREIQKNIKMDSEVHTDRVMHSGEEDKKEKILSILEKWMENCQRLRK